MPKNVDITRKMLYNSTNKRVVNLKTTLLILSKREKYENKR